LVIILPNAWKFNKKPLPPRSLLCASQRIDFTK
jgi:hypothetical protein